jgi:DNA-binding response OmpR family regulator
MKILIIEDDLIMTLLLTRMLKNLNYEVISAKDGKEGIELFNKSLPDLVITDMMLPFISGPEIISYLKKIPGNKAPVILLSSMPLGAFGTGNNNFDADCYLVKPVFPEELKNTIEALRSLEYA